MITKDAIDGHERNRRLELRAQYLEEVIKKHASHLWNDVEAHLNTIGENDVDNH